MDSATVGLIAVTVLAVVVALAFGIAYGRARAGWAAQTKALRSAYDEAGVDSLAEAVLALGEARRRTEAVAALAPAVDEIAERHQRAITAIVARDSVGAAAQDNLETALRAQDTAGEQIGELTRGVVEAGAAVEETVSSISTVSDNITGIADNVTSVSSAVGQLAVSVNQVAGSARDASTLSLEADRKAKDGGVAVERLVRSTREIADDIQGIVGKMQELGTASDRIGAIVEVIDAIADQTNLLALNAAIEAARAGEHGRGFAVVADEVRKLAESSAQSTREIGMLVKDIQAKTSEVVRSTTTSGEKAASGLQMADLAGRAIGDISTAVAEANRLIEQISMAAREQATGASAIVNSVEQMNGLMRQAARSLEEQNLSNQQIVTIITAIQRNASGVEDAISAQRTACTTLYESSKQLAKTSRAARDAVTGLDGVADALRERVLAIGTPARNGFENQLTGDREQRRLTGSYGASSTGR
ncbi:MAG TPA: methyl-accepting chemotaxis protein [Candidatus Sulfotelmatobacter sp.]|nr:methyl-accepting chemotaxis protein [Candidatus Sulfotelmatobacter sp.]